jgi:hypothetical protein
MIVGDLDQDKALTVGVLEPHLRESVTAAQ